MARTAWRRRVSLTLPALPRVVGCLLAALVVLILGAPTASAHAELATSVPANGAVVAEAPTAVALAFTEPVVLGPEALRLVDPSGGVTSLPAQATDSVVRAALPALDHGTYLVSWRVTSTDSHPISGVVQFSVGTAGAVPQLPNEPPQIDERLVGFGNGAALLGTLVVGGLVIFVVGIAPVRPWSPLTGRTWRWLAAAVSSVALLRTVITGLSLVTGADESWTAAVPGRDQLLLLVTLTGCWTAVLALSLRSEQISRGRRVLAGVAAAILIFGPVLTGHTATKEPRWLIMIADLAHLGAGAIWTGGLIGLIMVLRRPLADADSELIKNLVARFSTVAAISVAALGMSGVAMALVIFDAPSALILTGYGRTLMVKLILVAVVITIAAWNRRHLLPVATGGAAAVRQRLRELLIKEAALLCAVVATTGLLVSLDPTGSTLRQATASVSTPIAVDQPLGPDTNLRGTVTAVGAATEFSFTLTDGSGHPVAPLEPPQVRAFHPASQLGPLSATVTGPAADGTYIAPLDLQVSGEWRIEVAVRLDTFSEPISTILLTVP